MATNIDKLFTYLAIEKSNSPSKYKLNALDKSLVICLLEFCNQDKNLNHFNIQTLRSHFQISHQFIVSNKPISEKKPNEIIVDINLDGSLKCVECQVRLCLVKDHFEICDKTDSSFSSDNISAMSLYCFCTSFKLSKFYTVLCALNLNQEAFFEEFSEGELEEIFVEFLKFLECDKGVGPFALMMLLNFDSFIKIFDEKESIKQYFSVQIAHLSDNEFEELKSSVNFIKDIHRGKILHYLNNKILRF